MNWLIVMSTKNQVNSPGFIQPARNKMVRIEQEKIIFLTCIVPVYYRTGNFFIT